MNFRLTLGYVGWIMTSLSLTAAHNLQAEEPVYPKGYVVEAPLPEGVPPPGEVGEVVEKEYPLVRSYSATGKGQFMKCFSYLSLRSHKMTAPVVMEYDALREGEKVDPKSSEMPVGVKRMHFLLEKVSLDEPKKAVIVEVADMPKMRVLSIAHQGKLEADTVQGLEEKLKEALEKRPELASAGAFRILGYNSPMIDESKVYWEVQLPVTTAEKK